MRFCRKRVERGLWGLRSHTSCSASGLWNTKGRWRPATVSTRKQGASRASTGLEARQASPHPTAAHHTSLTPSSVLTPGCQSTCGC